MNTSKKLKLTSDSDEEEGEEIEEEETLRVEELRGVDERQFAQVQLWPSSIERT